MRRGRILIILGILLGVIVFAAVFFLLSQPRVEEQPVETVDLVVAAQEIPERAEIQAPWVELRPFLVGSEPVGAMQRPEDVIGKITIERIYQGEPILDVKLAITATLYGVPYALPDGMVAVAYPLTELSGVAGAIRAGDTVDLLFTLDVPAEEGMVGGGRDTTQLTLQDVLVLHVGTWEIVSGEAEGRAAGAQASVLIFQMSRQDALILKWAREHGIVDLALRPATDHNIIDLGTIEPVHIDYMIDTYRLPRPPVATQ
jgi:Flp pilus assembly protein CpaB